MGNKLATIAIYYNDDRTVLDIAINAPGISYEISNNTIIYKMPSEFGRFEAMRFIPTQNPSYLGGNLFFNVIGQRLESRTVTCAFTNQSGHTQSFASMGPYANGRDPYSNKYIIQGIMTITFDNPISSLNTNTSTNETFQYYLPTLRTYDAINSTITNEGVIKYDGQVVLDNPRLISMNYMTLDDLSNNKSQYLLDVTINNEDGNKLDVKYNNTYCPHIINVSNKDDGLSLLITTNIAIPNLSLVAKISDASLGIPNNLNLYLDNVDEYNTELKITNNSFRGIMLHNIGSYMILSILLLPL